MAQTIHPMILSITGGLRGGYDSPPSKAGTQELFRGINWRMRGVDGPVEEEGALPCMLCPDEVQSFLWKRPLFSSAAGKFIPLPPQLPPGSVPCPAHSALLVSRVE